MNDAELIVTLSVCVLLRFVTAYIAWTKGYSFILWFVLGALFCVIALPIAIFMKSERPADKGPPGSLPVSTELSRLAKLRADGSLSDEEFEILKSKAMSKVVETNGTAPNTLSTTAAVMGWQDRLRSKNAMIGVAVLSVLAIIGVAYFAFYGSLPSLRVELLTIQSVPVVKITNVGSEKIQIRGIQFNGRSECPPRLIGPFSIPMAFSVQTLQTGEAIAAMSGCPGSNIVRVTINTDHGEGQYYWQ